MAESFDETWPGKKDAAERKAKAKEAQAARRKAGSAYRDGLGERLADPRWRELFGDDNFILIDGGAAGWLQKEWEPVGPLMRLYAVEPRIAFQGPLVEANVDKVVIDAALDDISRTRQFYLAGSMSSFLRPDYEAWERFGFSERTVKTVQVRTTTLDAIVAEHGLRFVDFIKLDTQGTELDILRGGPVTVGDMALGLRVEMLFYPLYEGQALFADIDLHLRSQGFNLIGLTHFRRYRNLLTGDADKATMELSQGQLVVADGLYFRTPARLTARLETLSAPDRTRYLAGAVVACLTYTLLDLAAHYIHAAGLLIEPRSKALMLELLRA